MSTPLRLSTRFTIACAIVVLLFPTPSDAQNPTPDEVRQSLENPANSGAIRKRIRDSGMSPEQIRARLQNSGYPTDLLDRFFSPEAGADTTSPGQQQLGALTALGLAAQVQQQNRMVAGNSFEPLARKSKVFGVDVFQRAAIPYQPMFTGPVPPSYRLGAGDVLALILTGEVEQVVPLTITREGFGIVPRVGPSLRWSGSRQRSQRRLVLPCRRHARLFNRILHSLFPPCLVPPSPFQTAQIRRMDGHRQGIHGLYRTYCGSKIPEHL